ncbi:amino acid ABC transporter substrate-binding protein [Ruminococcus flavefaciens]|uniref:Amino acid ABC transporter substrate-binding protein, PAAT family n=1 Tax=Ruminococcus flavefaciens TaxID=1265 RepID=A0A1M7IQ60_RUMFL|nr:amino acid ABC transporter substrate-binding protein [Ruminococcus flavefaciens]SHM42870.1 amino acid ABC transporter substrate-binding protein, PAAT family [Ruminococcus flavefaciens]
MNKRFFRGILAGLAAVSMMSAATGCADPNKEADKSASKTTTEPYTKYSAEEEAENDNSSKLDPSLQKVYDNKKLVLGLDASFPPMGFTDESNEIIGFDIDVAQEVCDRMGIELVKQPINWDTKEEDLKVGKIDCIWNGMSINPARAEVMNLSEPYMKNEMIFVVPADSDIKSMDDLSGKTVGVQTGSSAQDILEASDLFENITETPLEDNVTALNQMELGFSDAVFLDSVVANYLITSHNKNYVILDGNLESEEYAIGFRKEDQTLRDEVQNQLHAMKEDGKLAEISTKWFGSDVTTVQ